MRTRLLLLAAIAVPLLGAGVLLTRAVVGTERERQLTDILRVALWRIDARASTMLLAEASRAPESFRSFWSPVEAFGEPLARTVRVRLPSPLLPLPESPVWLHVREHGGRIDSPQVPEGAERKLALDGLVPAEGLAEAESRLDELRRLLAVAGPPGDLPPPVAHGAFRDLPGGEAALAPGPAPRAQAQPRAEPPPAARPSTPPEAAAPRGVDTDFAGRALSNADMQRAARQFAMGQQFAPERRAERSRAVAEPAADTASPADAPAATRPPVAVAEAAAEMPHVLPAAASAPPPVPPPVTGMIEARWLGTRFLALARRARIEGREEVQMAVVDWPALQRQLIEPVADLLPGAVLRPLLPGDPQTARLASLPLHLDPGPAILPPLDPAARMTLATAWAALLAGLAGAGVLLVAAQRLAERRAAFVGAVTHELRTPLTALRLHADLLADPRIDGDGGKRRQRVGIVRAEAGRLAHLIDNVLDYARLERRQPPQARSMPLTDLLAPVLPRLRERLALAGMELAAEEPPGALVACDPAAVERILLNLVDNAAKYAAAGAQPVSLRILIGRRCELRLRDHGPGLAADVRRRLFAPFARSAEAAAGHAPGVGLGLALCRRLVRAQGGDLRLEEPADGGVEAVVELPLG